jgi:hypothetical protein
MGSINSRAGNAKRSRSWRGKKARMCSLPNACSSSPEDPSHNHGDIGLANQSLARALCSPSLCNLLRQCNRLKTPCAVAHLARACRAIGPPSPPCARPPSACSAMRHFDVQLIGGMVLHRAIAEMKTGEGKTLVATLPVYLNALAGKGVHVVTVNDYLAKRDAAWMGQVYKLPRPDRRRHRPRPRRRPAPRRLRLRRDLRHQQRTRLRLSARQHEVRARPDGPARPQLRDRRRSRLDPGRRGAHAADHFRPARGPLRPLQHRRRLHPEAGRRPIYEIDEKQRSATFTEAGTRSWKACCCARPACSRATRSTTSRTSPSSTTSTRRCAPTSCSSATRTTSSATTRSSSSTSSPAA